MRIVIDLDGTICTQEKSGQYHLAKPVEKTIAILRFRKFRGDYIIIYTARGMNSFNGDVSKIIDRYDRETRDWLHRHNVPYDELVFGKPAGDIYVDDKAMNVNDWF